VPLPLTIVSSSPLPAGTEGNINAGTRRWSLSGEPLSTIGPSVLTFDQVDDVSGPINGHFWRTTTTPPVYIAWSDIKPLEAALSAPAPAPSVPVIQRGVDLGYGFLSGTTGTGSVWTTDIPRPSPKMIQTALQAAVAGGFATTRAVGNGQIDYIFDTATLSLMPMETQLILAGAGFFGDPSKGDWPKDLAA
jgi:hypothetical protein